MGGWDACSLGEPQVQTLLALLAGSAPVILIAFSHLSNNLVFIVTGKFRILSPIIGYKSFVYGRPLRRGDALRRNQASGCP